MPEKREIWTRPWGYKEGALIAIALLLVGFIIEYIMGGIGTDHLIQYPNNLILGLIIIVSILVLGLFGKKLQITIWLQSVPAAICAITLLIFVTLLMGVTPQNDALVPLRIKLLGLSHVLSSWIYLQASLFLILSLGLTIVKNLVHFEKKKFGFIISHLGLWIVLFGANFGSVQVTRSIMELKEGQISNQSIDPSSGIIEELPFAIKLNDFILKEYTPKLTLVDNVTGKIAEYINNKTIIADSGASLFLGNWNIKILDYIYTSAKAGNRYHFVNEIGASPSAKIMAISNSNDTVTGWVSCGSFNRQYEALKLNNNYSIVMLFPEPKDFISKLSIIDLTKPEKTINLEVNKPYTIKGYKIYQMGYNENLSRWSDTTILELIRDPWLWFVYTGIFLMLVGAVYMFLMGSNTGSPVTKNSKNDS